MTPVAPLLHEDTPNLTGAFFPQLMINASNIELECEDDNVLFIKWGPKQAGLSVDGLG